jgi:hypothetical protein
LVPKNKFLKTGICNLGDKTFILRKIDNSNNHHSIFFVVTRWVNIASVADALNRPFREEFVSGAGNNVATRGATTMLFREKYVSRTARR